MRCNRFSRNQGGIRSRSKIVLSFLVLGIFFPSVSGSPVLAQQVPGGKPIWESEEKRLPDLEEKRKGPPPELVLPSPTSRKKELEKGVPLTKVFIRQIIITGNTVFTGDELSEITKAYVNKELTSEDIEALRQELTLHYINEGYINSGAIIPNQTIVNGVIRLQVIEGRLTHIEVENNKWFSDRFIADRLTLGPETPMNIRPLQQRLQLLQQNDLIKRVHAELKPGVKPGESVLKVRVDENRPVKVQVGFDNYQSPTVGAERGWLTVAHQNLTGRGDILSLSYGRSEGVNPQIDAWYSLPFTARDTSLTMRYRRNDFDVVEEPFEPLDIESESDIYQLTLRQPFYRTLNQEFAMSLTGERLWNKTSLLGEPFSFSPGAEDGESTVTALRFSQEWTYRTRRQVIAARSRFSFGIDALGATNHTANIPDGRFFSWLGQFQWARVLGPWDVQMIFRTDLQLATDPLLPLEQFAVGGRYSVRGYRENQLVRDQGLIASLESRIPLVRNKRWADYLQLTPFVDFGRVWNEDVHNPSPETIASIGLGLRWEATLMKSPFELRPRLEIYWGYPLKDVDTPEDNLQDDGIHFQIVIAGF